MTGDKLYQVRARNAFPILVRQAKAHEIISYTDLAEELNMPNARNLNYVLGYIGKAIKRLNRGRVNKIPYINFLVVNKYTELPGKGAFGFLKYKKRFNQGTLKARKALQETVLSDIFNFNDWDRVLTKFKLKPIDNILPNKKSIQNQIDKFVRHGTGESPYHKRFKNYIARNPDLIGLPKNASLVKTEYEFLSYDAIDILFKNQEQWIGVEVKSIKSPREDLIRGIFQSIKYHSLLEATLKMDQIKPLVNIILVLEGKLPKDLIDLKTTLGVNVKDNIKVK